MYNLQRNEKFPNQVVSRLPSYVVDQVLEKTQLAGFFPYRITAEDERFDDYRGFMLVSTAREEEFVGFRGQRWMADRHDS